jgi:hypothetical protein
MNKEKFLAGTPFRVKGIHNRKGGATFFYKDGCIMKQIRSGEDDRLILEDYHLNTTTIDDKWFSGITYVMDKQVVVKYRFTKLVVFEPEISVGE